MYIEGIERKKIKIKNQYVNRFEKKRFHSCFKFLQTEIHAWDEVSIFCNSKIAKFFWISIFFLIIFLMFCSYYLFCVFFNIRKTLQSWDKEGIAELRSNKIDITFNYYVINEYVLPFLFCLWKWKKHHVIGKPLLKKELLDNCRTNF